MLRPTVAPSGLFGVIAAYRRLTPPATHYRPFGPDRRV